MALLRITDAAMHPIVVNTDHILMLAPTDQPNLTGIVFTEGHPPVICMTPFQTIVDRWDMATKGIPFELAGSKPEAPDKN